MQLFLNVLSVFNTMILFGYLVKKQPKNPLKQIPFLKFSFMVNSY